MTIQLTDYEKAVVVLALRMLAQTELQKAVDNIGRGLPSREATQRGEAATYLADKVQLTN